MSSRICRAAIPVACRILAIGVTWVASVVPGAAEVTTPRDRWQGKEGECLTLASDPVKAESIRRLALVLLGQHDEKVGCTTFPYLGSPYSVAGNEAHAGIDFRANGVPVRAAEAGRVVVKSFDPKDERSTLIIENNGRSRKTLYLHMSSIEVEQGDYVLAGQQVGTAGSVGTVSAHLHFEVWPAYSPLYCGRERSISGSACPQDGGTCSLNSIQSYTGEPEMVIQYPDNTARPKRTTAAVSYEDPVTFDGVSRLKVGMTAWDALVGMDELVIGDDSGECSMVKLQSASCGLAVMLQNGQIARVDIDQGEYRTVEGIGIGSSEDELKRVFGLELESRPNMYATGVVDITVNRTINGQRRSMLFNVGSGRVLSFRAGSAGAVANVEHCL